MHGPPYPLDYDEHSTKEKKLNPKGKIDGDPGTSKKSSQHIHLTDKQKKAVKIGAAIVGTALVAAGGYYLYKSGAARSIIDSGKNAASKLGLARTNKHLPGDLGGSCNPEGYHNNCKDVSEAVLKRWLGVDSSAVAGPKTVNGNLHDFVDQHGYNKSGVIWIGGDAGGIAPDPNGDSYSRIVRQLNRKFSNGDCGMISVGWDKKYLRPGSSESGHAFNWYKSNDQIHFYDDQPDPPITKLNVEKFNKLIDPNTYIELCKITKEAFG